MKDAGVKGRLGEDEALSFFLQKGYNLIQRNFRTRGGEVDLILEKDTLLLFVEVKARSRSYLGAGLEAVTGKKQRRIIKAAGEYLLLTNQFNRPLRFDVAEVTSKGITHVENAFSGEW